MKELDRIDTAPVTEPELEQARRYCTAQLLSVFDSPASLTAALCHGLSTGVGARWLQQLPDLLAAVTAPQATAATRELFAPTRTSAVILGDTEVVEHISEVVHRPADATGRLSAASTLTS